MFIIGQIKMDGWMDLMPSPRVILFEFPDDLTWSKTRMIELSDSEDLMILAWFI